MGKPYPLYCTTTGALVYAVRVEDYATGTSYIDWYSTFSDQGAFYEQTTVGTPSVITVFTNVTNTEEVYSKTFGLQGRQAMPNLKLQFYSPGNWCAVAPLQ